jgi:hypothetical protein
LIDDVRGRLTGYNFVIDHADVLSAAPADAFTMSIFRDPPERLLSERREWAQQIPKDLVVAPPAIVSATAASAALDGRRPKELL